MRTKSIILVVSLITVLLAVGCTQRVPFSEISNSPGLSPRETTGAVTDSPASTPKETTGMEPDDPTATLTPTPTPTTTPATTPATTPTPGETIDVSPKPTGDVPNDDFDTEPNTLLDAYRAYYELIESLIDTYGVGYNPGSSDFVRDLDLWWTYTYSGVVYAEFIDFDNDGQPELLVILNDGGAIWSDIWAIFGYTGQVELYCERYIGFEGGGGADAKIATSRNGVTYLEYADYFGVYDDEWEYYYYTVVDGSWRTAMTRSAMITDESRVTYNFQWQWLVNGDPVSENEYEMAPETLLGVTGIRQIPFYTRYEEDLDTKNARAYDFIYSLLAEIEDRISQLEA